MSSLLHFAVRHERCSAVWPAEWHPLVAGLDECGSGNILVKARESRCSCRQRAIPARIVVARVVNGKCCSAVALRLSRRTTRRGGDAEYTSNGYATFSILCRVYTRQLACSLQAKISQCCQHSAHAQADCILASTVRCAIGSSVQETKGNRHTLVRS